MRGPCLAEQPSKAYPCWVNPSVDHRAQSRSRGRLVSGRVEAVVGDDMEVVSSQDLSVRVLVTGAGVEARVSQLQALY